MSESNTLLASVNSQLRPCFFDGEMTTLHTLGQRLAQARRELAVRERRDVSQADVADAVGYSRTAVSEWEAGTKMPREEALAKLARSTYTGTFITVKQ